MQDAGNCGQSSGIALRVKVRVTAAEDQPQEELPTSVGNRLANGALPLVSP